MNGSAKKEQTRVLSCTHPRQSACNAVGVAFGAEESNRADNTFRSAEILTSVTNPRFCDCNRMHAACMQIFENAINRLRRLAE